MTKAFATIDDVIKLWKPLTPSEIERAEVLLTIVSDVLRNEATKVNKDMDLMIEDSTAYANTAKMVTVDIVARVLMTSTDHEPMTQFAESANGYSVSGSFLNPGGGIFITNQEKKLLGLKTQKLGVIDFYG